MQVVFVFFKKYFLKTVCQFPMILEAELNKLSLLLYLEKTRPLLARALILFFGH